MRDHDYGHESSNQDDHLDHRYDSHSSKQHSHQPQQRQHPQQWQQQQSYSQLNGRSTNDTSTSTRAVHSPPQGDVMEVPIAQLQGGAQAQMTDAYPPSEYPPEAEYAGDSVESGERAPCPICQRMFAVERLRKHAKICEKSTKKLAKRKLPPPKAVLVEQAKEEIKGKLKGGGKAGKGKDIGGRSSLAHDNVPIGGQNAGSKWRRDRDQLREAMQAARAYSKAKKEGGPLPPPTAPTIDPSLVPCPHCGRRFNENAAQRHIPICARKAQNVANQNRGRRR